MGIGTNGSLLYTLLFADNRVRPAGDKYGSDYMMTKLTEIYSKAGLKVNLKEGNFLAINGD